MKAKKRAGAPTAKEKAKKASRYSKQSRLKAKTKAAELRLRRQRADANRVRVGTCHQCVRLLNAKRRKRELALPTVACQKTDVATRMSRMVGILKYQAGNVSKDPEKAELAQQALQSYNMIMGRNESAVAERQKFLAEFEKSAGGKDKTKLKWLVTYSKKAVSNDVVETGCLENFFTRLSVWFLFPDLVRPPPQEVKIASSVGGRLII